MLLHKYIITFFLYMFLLKSPTIEIFQAFIGIFRHLFGWSPGCWSEAKEGRQRKQGLILFLRTVCPRSSDPFYIVTYYIKRVTNSWTDSTICPRSTNCPDPFYLVTYYIKWVLSSWTYRKQGHFFLDRL